MCLTLLLLGNSFGLLFVLKDYLLLKSQQPFYVQGDRIVSLLALKEKS